MLIKYLVIGKLVDLIEWIENFDFFWKNLVENRLLLSSHKKIFQHIILIRYRSKFELKAALK